MLSPLRKELKNRGQIGETGQKDKLTYVSLMHQIKQASLTGYTDQEVINAVISSIVLWFDITYSVGDHPKPYT